MITSNETFCLPKGSRAMEDVKLPWAWKAMGVGSAQSCSLLR